MSLPIAPYYPFKALKLLENFDLAVLHAPFPLSDLIHAIPLFSRVPFIVYWHADIRNKGGLGRLFWPLVRQTLKRAHTILVSDASLISAKSGLDEFRAKISIVPFPVRITETQVPEHKQPLLEKIRTEFPRLIIAVGRLVGYKGFDVLIRAAKSIDAQVVIIGDGPERHKLQSLAQKWRGSRPVQLLGPLADDDLACYLRAANVFVLPSITAAETFGVAQLEAMAAGLPIVNTRLPTAVPNVARHMVEALTVEPNNPGELGSAINRLLGDSALRNSLAAASLRRARSFSYDSFQEQLTLAYQSAAGIARSAPVLYRDGVSAPDFDA